MQVTRFGQEHVSDQDFNFMSYNSLQYYMKSSSRCLYKKSIIPNSEF